MPFQLNLYVPTLVFKINFLLLGNAVFKFFPTTTQDLSRRCIATRRESVSTYPHRPKAEAFSNAVDVVERLHDPTDPSAERTTPP